MYRSCALLCVAKIGAFAGVLVVSLAGNAFATLIIDSFNVAYSSQPLFMFPNGANIPDFNTVLTGDIIGDSREATLQWVSGLGITYSTINLSSSGNLDFAQGPGTSGKLTLLWNGETAIGQNTYNLGANLTSDGSTRFIADIKDVDLNIPFRVEVYTDATHSSYYDGVFLGNQTGLKYLAFSDFHILSGSGADFSNVGAIKFIIDGTNSPDADLSINSITTGVPEPATFLLILYGLMGLGLHVHCCRRK